jgi:LmbE family N-acetylglucosaminyl deacetylase
MEILDLSKAPATALVVVAHPDDIDFGMAGTIATLTAAGSRVVYCLATDGSAGEGPAGLSRAEVGALRREEQRKAAAVVGVHEVHFLGHPDGAVQATMELRRDISRVIREVRPDVVLSQSPERRWDRIYASHPDHIATAEATIAAVYPDSRNPYAHPELLTEGYEPHAVPEVWVVSLDPLDLFVDVTDAIDRKVAALRCHESQTGAFDVEQLVRGWAQAQGQLAGLHDGRMAEGFRKVSTA